MVCSFTLRLSERMGFAAQAEAETMTEWVVRRSREAGLVCVRATVRCRDVQPCAHPGSSIWRTGARVRDAVRLMQDAYSAMDLP